MAGFIFGILALIIGIITGFSISAKQGKQWISRCTIIGLVVFAVFTSFGCIASVDTGHTGVLTVFGRVEDRTFDAGFHVKAPWEKVIQMDNRVQKAVVDLECFSSDIQEVTCKYTLNYKINKANAQKLYSSIGLDYYSTAITPTVAESVKTIMAHYTAEELIGSRDNLAASVEELLVKELTKYDIEVVSTAIEDLDFTDTFTNAVEAKQVAAQNKLKAEIEQAQAVKQAQADAEVAKTKAEADAEVAKMKAQADAEVAKIQAEADMEVAKIGADSAEYQGRKDASVNMQKLASINGWTVVMDEATSVNRLMKPDGTVVNETELVAGVEKLMQYYYTETWNGILPETYVGNDDASTIILK